MVGESGKHLLREGKKKLECVVHFTEAKDYVLPCATEAMYC